MDPDVRAGARARREARRLHLEFLQERWRPIVVLALLILAVTGVVAVVVPRDAALFVVGLGVASAGWAVAMVVVQVSGSISYLLGAQGEESTARALRKALPRGWHIADHLPLRWGDIDHVLVGPGGAYAIETKTASTSRRWNLAKPDQWLLQACRQARTCAKALRSLLRAHGSDLRTEVTPVLVLWGDTVGEVQELDGVQIVAGTELSGWAQSLGDEGLNAHEVERAAAGISRYLVMRDDYNASSEEKASLLIEVGPLVLLGKLARGICGALGFMLVFALAAQVLATLAIVALMVGLTVAGLGALRVPVLRSAAIGWLVTDGAIALTLAGLVILASL